MDLHLRNKVFIITGGAKGIGNAIVQCLISEKALVVIADRDIKASQKLKQEIQNKGGTIYSIITDLKTPGACKNIINKTIRKFSRIDGIVNNAGINDGVSVENDPPKTFIESLESNLVHYYAMVHYALPELKKTKGAIVNIGSKVSLTGQGETSGYVASKGGIDALTREWAIDFLPYSIRVNAVVPGEVWTPQYKRWIEKKDNPKESLKDIISKIPFGRRFTTVEEIANTVTFILSNRSSHTTGEIIVVDGGYTHLDRSI